MSKQPLNVLITKKADADEESIYNYIFRRFGKIYADKFCSNIIALFRKIALTPTAGRLAKKDPSLRVFIFYLQNKVVYKTTEANVTIIRILNAKTKSASKY